MSFGPWILVSASDLSEVSFYLDLGLNSFMVWPSNSCALIQCFEVYIYLCLSTIFLRMQTWSPENSDSPKLVEMISIKLLSLVWCLFCHYYLQELTLKDRQQQLRDNHIRLFDGMHAFCTGLESFIAPPLIGDHLLDQFFCFGDSRVEGGSSSNSIKVGLRCRCEPIVEALQDEPLVHAMMRTGQDVFQQPLPSFRDGFHPRLLET